MVGKKAFLAPWLTAFLLRRVGRKGFRCAGVLLIAAIMWTSTLRAEESQKALEFQVENEQLHLAMHEGDPLEEAKRLNQELVALHSRGKYKEAISVAVQVLLIRERALGADHTDVAESLQILAMLHHAQGETKAAEPLFLRGLAILEKALGTEHLDVAVLLNNLGKLYNDQGLYMTAEAMYKRALAIREKSLGSEHQDVANTLENLAWLYQVKGQYAAAEPLVQRALAIKEKILGAEHPDVARTLETMAELYLAQGQYVAAESLCRRTLIIREKALGAEHPDVARSLNSLAMLLDVQGRYEAAEPIFRRALAIRERLLGAEHPEVAGTLNNLAWLYQRQGQYVAAEPLYRRALMINEKALGLEHPNVTMILKNLGSLYQIQGKYTAAAPLYQRALAIEEMVLGAEHPSVATTLNSLAHLYRDQGQYAAAEPLYRRALAVEEKVLGAEHPSVASTLNSLAVLYQAQGRYAAAESLYLRAIAAAEKALGAEHPSVATLLDNLADIYRHQGRYAAAEALSRRALLLGEKALGTEHPDLATKLNNLAVLYQVQEQYSAAEPLYRRALAVLEKALGAEHPSVATALNNLAELYRDQGQYAAAVPLYQRTLAIREKALGAEHPFMAGPLNSMAVTLWAMDDLSGALELMDRAAENQEHHLSVQLSAGSERQKRQYLDTVASTLGVNLSLHLRAVPGRPEAARLALTTVLRRKGRALDAMTDQIDSLRRHLSPADQSLLDELAGQRKQLATLMIKTSGSDEGPIYRTKISTLEEKLQELEQKIAARSSTFAVQIQPVTIDRVRRALPSDAALVEMVSYMNFDPKAKRTESWGTRQYAAYVLMPAGAIQFVVLGKASVIDHALGDFGEALANPGTFHELKVKQAGRALDELVMRPIRSLLGNTTRLLLAPDGDLNLLPFAALVDEQGRYLVERYSITYLTSGRDLLRMQERADSRSVPFVMANPAFDLVGATTIALAPAADGVRGRRSGDLPQRWGPLKGTAQEAAAMKALLSRVQVLEGPSATEGALKRVEGPEILHIATHGFFLPDQPSARPLAVEHPLLRSGLVLAGANARNGGEGEDGILTALEAAGLDLWGTKLVVLSACETGLGQVSSGEGVYGLRRALVLAGVESQLISLWQVDDKATRDLMVAYYEQLLAGVGRSDALRVAQLGMLKDPERQHPNYWSAFIPVGDWRNLRGDHR